MSCEHCADDNLHLVACYVPLPYGDCQDIPVSYCPACGAPLTEPKPLTRDKVASNREYLTAYQNNVYFRRAVDLIGVDGADELQVIFRLAQILDDRNHKPTKEE